MTIDKLMRNHVYPVSDLRKHETEGEDCWCQPIIDEYGVVVHNSMDQREKYETGERKPS
jgi:hypothetical protein